MPDNTDAIKLASAEAWDCVDRIATAYDGFPWEDRRAYANWLAQTYYYVRHASRVLSLAAACCSLAEETIHRIFLKGIQEEHGHEELAANDLKTLGHSPADFQEFPETTSYYQTLYFAIEYDGPAALFGYFLPLEGLAALKMHDAVQRVRQTYTGEGASFSRVHCELDVAHFQEGLETLRLLETDQIQVVRRALEYSTTLYIRIIERIRKETGEGLSNAIHQAV